MQIKKVKKNLRKDVVSILRVVTVSDRRPVNVRQVIFKNQYTIFGHKSGFNILGLRPAIFPNKRNNRKVVRQFTCDDD
jgi:hypothetical protein